MKNIRILGEAYALPLATSGALHYLQLSIDSRRQLVQEGVRVRSRPRFLGLFSRKPEIIPLTNDDRFEELSLIVADYDAVIAHLNQSKGAYLAFFEELAVGIRKTINNKIEKIQSADKDRQEILARARRENHADVTLIRNSEIIKDRLIDSLRVLGHATLLLLRKIRFCQEAIKALAEDQDKQRKVLAAFVARLDTHRRMLALEKQVDRIQQDVADIAQVALTFEAYVRDYFGPLQMLIGEVAGVDTKLHRAVEEIQTLSDALMNSSSQELAPLGADEGFIDFLVHSSIKRDHLCALFEQGIKNVNEAVEFDMALAEGKPASISVAVQNIQSMIDVALPKQASTEASKKEKEARPGMSLLASVQPPQQADSSAVGLQQMCPHCCKLISVGVQKCKYCCGSIDGNT
jgi:hypothetical protein